MLNIICSKLLTKSKRIFNFVLALGLIALEVVSFKPAVATPHTQAVGTMIGEFTFTSLATATAHYGALNEKTMTVANASSDALWIAAPDTNDRQTVEYVPVGVVARLLLCAGAGGNVPYVAPG
jgi:hypothetical protein